ncbi:Putative integrase fragment [Mycobacterium tuberculosis]|nr:Putative integrase fragment [Mycobacterium tuberculosis]
MANSPGSGRVSARTPAKLTRRSKVTFTRAWPASNNDGCPTEQKYWAMVCTAVGYHRDDPAAELLLRNEGLAAAVQTGPYVYPPQKLVAKVRAGAKVSDNHDQATTLFQHAIDHPTVTVQQTYSLINPQSAPGRWTLIRWGPAGSLVLRITLCRVSELPARRSPRSNARDRCQAGTRTSWVSIRSATKKVSKPACVR